jgi:hypothetical protein
MSTQFLTTELIRLIFNRLKIVGVHAYKQYIFKKHVDTKRTTVTYYKIDNNRKNVLFHWIIVKFHHFADFV